MINKQYFIYSKAALARMLKVSITAIVKFEVWFGIVFAVVKGIRCRFFSFKTFKQHFAEFRKQSAVFLNATKWLYDLDMYTVRNDRSYTSYTVQVNKTIQECDCEDYQNQIKFGFKRACCKHIYAVLNQLGHSSLADYLSST